MFIVTVPPDDSLKLRRSGMVFAGPHHAASMGLKTVLFGRWYYKHVAPTELAAQLPTIPTMHQVIDCARKLQPHGTRHGARRVGITAPG